jgi:hypothetical protein
MMIARRFRRLFTLPGMWSSPFTPDSAALWGLIGGMANTNVALNHLEQITTAGTNTTLTATQCRRLVLYLNSGASAGFTITLPSTSAILAAFGPTIITDGTQGFLRLIVNNGVGQIGTLTAGDASTTLTGTMTIATNTARLFMCMITAPTTLTYFNCGSMSL